MKVNYSISIKSGCKSAFLHGLNQVGGVNKMIRVIQDDSDDLGQDDFLQNLQGE